MPKPLSLRDDHFLNRLTLQEMKNAETIDSYDRLQDTFSFGELPELQKLFNAFFKAAMREDYRWKQGTPGNCLWVAEEIEAVIESCYLILISSKKEEAVKTENPNTESENVRVFTRLTEEEWLDPLMVLKKFFAYQPLAEWKDALHRWLEAALSNHSITTIVDPKNVLPFCTHLQKLLEAAHWITIRCTSNQPKQMPESSLEE